MRTIAEGIRGAERIPITRQQGRTIVNSLRKQSAARVSGTSESKRIGNKRVITAHGPRAEKWCVIGFENETRLAIIQTLDEIFAAAEHLDDLVQYATRSIQGRRRFKLGAAEVVKTVTIDVANTKDIGGIQFGSCCCQ